MLLAVLLLPTAVPADAPVIGEVTSVSGRATATQPGGVARPLACGDPILAGDLVETSAGARVGVLQGDVMTYLDESSALRMGATAGAAPDATLEKGRVRRIDPRDGGAEARLGALETQVAGVGNDLEAYILTEKVGPYAMFCEWDAPLAAERGPQHLTLGPGECVIAKAAEPLYLAKAHEQRIAAAPDEVCGPDPALIAALAGAPARHLSPADVAAGPVGLATSKTAGLGLFDPVGPEEPVRESCDVSGACNFPIIVIEPPPGALPTPGAGGPFPIQ
jgi:hypothetical protein